MKYHGVRVVTSELNANRRHVEVDPPRVELELVSQTATRPIRKVELTQAELVSLIGDAARALAHLQARGALS